jgi:hypothetical protein
MNRAAAGVLLMTISMFSVSHGHATADGCALVLRTPDDHLNIRRGPKATTGIVGFLFQGDTIVIDSATCDIVDGEEICSDGSWVRVRETDEERKRQVTVGWVATKYIKEFDCSEMPRIEYKHPFVGRWYFTDRRTCLKNYNSDDKAIVVTEERMFFYESNCKLRILKALNPTTNRLKLICDGVEMHGHREAVAAILSKTDIHDELLIMIDLNDGVLLSFKRCP